MLKLFADFSVMITEAMGIGGILLVLFPLAVMTGLYLFEIGIIIVQAYIFVLITCLYIRDALHAH